MRVIATPADAGAFAPHGAFVEGPALHGDRRLYSDWLTPVADLHLQFHINSVAASALPVTLTRIEKHPHAAQVFVPLQVRRYLVTVLPSDSDGQPDPTGALCMIVPGNTGVIYRAGCWHGAVTALDEDAQFAVMMWRGAADDDMFQPVAPLMILPSLNEQRGTRS